jgi:hypothetical protein
MVPEDIMSIVMLGWRGSVLVDILGIGSLKPVTYVDVVLGHPSKGEGIGQFSSHSSVGDAR